MQDSIDLDDIYTETELDSVLSKKKFPRKVREELKTRLKPSLISRIDNKRAKDLFKAKGKIVEREDNLRRGIWRGRVAYYIRDAKGRIKTWTLDKEAKVDYVSEKRKLKLQIETKKYEIQVLQDKLKELKKYESRDSGKENKN